MLPETTPKIKLTEDERTMQLARAGLIEPWDYIHLLRPPRRKRKPKNQSSIIKRALRAAVRAGFEPTGFRVGDTGEITVFTKAAERTASSPTSEVNEWDEVNGAA